MVGFNSFNTATKIVLRGFFALRVLCGFNFTAFVQSEYWTQEKFNILILFAIFL